MGQLCTDLFFSCVNSGKAPSKVAPSHMICDRFKWSCTSFILLFDFAVPLPAFLVGHCPFVFASAIFPLWLPAQSPDQMSSRELVMSFAECLIAESKRSRKECHSVPSLFFFLSLHASTSLCLCLRVPHERCHWKPSG